MRFVAVVLASLFVLLSCNKKVGLTSEKADNLLSEYKAEVEAARLARIAELEKPQGWLSVVGLHWLSPGVNTIGAAADNNIIFPRIETETIGAYQLGGEEVFFGKVEGVDVLSNGTEYLGGPVDVDYPPTVVNHQSLYWYIIKRGEKYGIRLKDTLAEQRMSFDGIPYSEINQDYKVKARVAILETEETVSITNVLGNVTDYPIAAELTFTVAGKDYTIVALDEGGDNYFVILGDATNGSTTYGGGRFLYPKKPATGESTTTLDFNLLQNPPCAFSDFATCPLPPARNRLSIALPVGELKMESGH